MLESLEKSANRVIHSHLLPLHTGWVGRGGGTGTTIVRLVRMVLVRVNGGIKEVGVSRSFGTASKMPRLCSGLILSVCIQYETYPGKGF